MLLCAFAHHSAVCLCAFAHHSAALLCAPQFAHHSAALLCTPQFAHHSLHTTVQRFCAHVLCMMQRPDWEASSSLLSPHVDTKRNCMFRFLSRLCKVQRPDSHVDTKRNCMFRFLSRLCKVQPPDSHVDTKTNCMSRFLTPVQSVASRPLSGRTSFIFPPTAGT